MSIIKNNKRRFSSQIIGNIGLFYICYELSKRGWNCLPTTRNAKGVDLVIYSQNAKKSYTIQVKSLSKENPIPFGKELHLIADFVVAVINVCKEKPEVIIMKPKDVKKRVIRRKSNKGETSYWLPPLKYKEFKENWKIIGDGWNDC